jgi:hypothetical protein
MTSIKPIIRKNLIYAWRSKVTTLFSLFYPCIFLSIFILISNSDNKSASKEPQTYYNFLKNFNLIDDYKYVNIWSISQEDSYAIIGENPKITQDLKDYLVMIKSKIFYIFNLPGASKIFTA